MPRKAGRFAGSLVSSKYNFDSAHLYLPNSDPQLKARQSEGQAQPFAVWFAHRSNRKLAGIIEWVQSLLVALGINFLPKIALLVEQTNSDHGDAQVTCGFELIAGNVAEPARINRQRFAQHELHREIRNRRHARTRMRLLKPRFRLFGKRFLAVEISQEFLKSWVGGNTLQFFAGDGLQQNPRIVGQFPEFWIELLPKLVRRVIERPSY